MTTTLKDPLAETLVMEDLSIPGYERVLKIVESRSGLKALIAIHDTTMGPALGGTRIYPYLNFDEALNDVLRLSKGMTYKSAVTESGWGGGKSVIICDAKHKTEALLTAFGHVVNRFQGAYICAEDLGCTPQDIAMITRVTPYAVGLDNEKSSGNPSPFTAWGTFRGMQAVLKHLYKNSSLRGRRIAIQGLGSVGQRVAELLFWHGARLILCDIDRQKAVRLAAQYGGEVVDERAILSVECDIFSPCALGGILNPTTIPNLRCRAIAGSANNQLLNDQDADLLKRRGILYAPDFVINAGGLINVTFETVPEGYRPEKACNKVDKIYDQLSLIFDIADKNQISTHRAAIQLAEYRIRYGIGKRTEPVYMHHANLSFVPSRTRG